jgi:cobalamin biosynthesis protein CbiD
MDEEIKVEDIGSIVLGYMKMHTNVMSNIMEILTQYVELEEDDLDEIAESIVALQEVEERLVELKEDYDKSVREEIIEQIRSDKTHDAQYI